MTKTYKETEDNIKCKICGKKYKYLGTHIAKAHGITTREYKQMYGFDYNLPLMSKEVQEKKRVAFNKDRDKYLNNLKKGKKYRFKKGKINREYFSKQSKNRALENLKIINDSTIRLQCPFCNMKYKNLQVHLMNKHKVKIVKLYDSGQKK